MQPCGADSNKSWKQMMSRRRLLAIGTAHYDDDQFEDLEMVPAAVQIMIQTFEVLGFHTQLIDDPTKAAFEDAVESWLNEELWNEDDVAVLYVTGHGMGAAAGHYLAMTDTRADRYAKAVETRFISNALGDDPPLGQLLIMLDTCYAEGGADALVGLAASMKQHWSQRPGRQYWVVTSARSKQEAQQLVFAQAFSQALEDLRGSFGTMTPSIPLTTVVGRINLLLERPPFSVAHRASVTPLLPSPGDDGFFENPSYVPIITPDVAPKVATQDELRSHWLPLARGGAADGEQSLFRGRTTLIRDITFWGSSIDRTRLLVVTGAPGTGKSALLARFVAASVAPDKTSTPEAQLPLVRAVHARNLTAELIRRRVSDLLEPAPDDRPRTVIIDALDESVDPDNLMAMVIWPLIVAGLRVAVGSRSALARTLVADTVEINLDCEVNDDDLKRYIASVLELESSSPYHGNPQALKDVAAEVSSMAGSSFLLAGRIARALASRDRMYTGNEVRAAQASFGSVAAAFEADMARLGDRTGVTRELLTALAWSRGAGLPWEGIWPAVAGALFGRSYSTAEVARTQTLAADYVVETPVAGRSYFRLYHELFGEHLRSSTDSVTANQRIVDALVQQTPTDAAGNRDWTGAHPYVRDFLAEHAVRGHVLDQVLADPRLIVALDPERLAVALADSPDRAAHSNESAVMRCLEHLRQPNKHRFSQLALAALQTGSTGLADLALPLARQGAWWPQWVRWTAAPAHAVLTRLAGAVVHLRTVGYDEELLAIAASGSGELVCTAVLSGRKLWSRNFEKVSAIATGYGVVAVGTGPGRVHVLDLGDGHEIAGLPGPGPGLWPSTSALGVHHDGSDILVATGTYNEDDPDANRFDPDDPDSWGGRLRLFRLAKPGEPVWETAGFATGVRSLHFRAGAAGHELVAGGDPYREHRATAAVVRVFDIRTGALATQLSGFAASWADALPTADGQILFAPLTAAASDPIIRWNPATGGLTSQALSDRMLTHVHTLTPDGSVWLVGTYDGVIAVSPTTLKPFVDTAAAHLGGPSALASGFVSGRVVVLTGHYNGEVSRWDMSAFLGQADTDVSRRVGVVAAAAVGSTLISYSLEDGSLETAGRDDGRLVGRRERIYASALHWSAATGELFAGFKNGEIGSIDIQGGGGGVRRRLHTGTVTSITEAHGLLVTSGRDALVQVVDPRMGPVCLPLLHADYKRRPLEQVAVTPVAGIEKIVALDYDGELVLWNWDEVRAGKIDLFVNDEVFGDVPVNDAHSVYLRGSNSGARAFCGTQVGAVTVFFRPGVGGAVDVLKYPGGQTPGWPAHDQDVIAVEMLTPDVLLTADRGGRVRAWTVPDPVLLAEAAIGASINRITAIGGSTVIVATEYGLAVIEFALPAGADRGSG